LFYFNQHYFGSWRTLAGALPSWKGVVETPISTTTPSALDVPVEKNVVGFFKEQYVPKGFGTLLFSKDRGLFFFVPILLLAFFGIFRVLRKGVSLASGVLLLLVLLNVLLYSSWGDPWGGWAYGPRYLIPSMSILAIFVGVAVFEFGKYWWFKLSAFVLFAFSSGVALLGALTTNANPARDEALALRTGDNFFRNWVFLKNGHSGSFMYNTVFSSHISLLNYFIVLWVILLIVVGALLFFQRKGEYGN
jgi:hypothetical protein